MDLRTQEEILKAATHYDKKDIIVLLGSPSPEAAEIAAETVVNGDPTYAGPLAEVQLGLPVFHILEDRVRDAMPSQVYEEQVGLMETVLDKEHIVKALEQIRARM
jgi:hypothetical protein